MGQNRPHIAVAILDWGWGHAMRCLPIIESALDKGYRITLASGDQVLDRLGRLFPELHTLKLPSYKGQYRWNNMAMNIAMKAPELIQALEKERDVLKKQHHKTPFDAIISDGRYGCFIEDRPSFFLTHQLHIKARKKLTDTMANTVQRQWLGHFTEIWVPDFEEAPGLGSQLSHKCLEQNCQYLGPISRFYNSIPAESPVQYEWLFILNGPEPARAQLEKQLCQISQSQADKKFMFVTPRDAAADLEKYSHLSHCVDPDSDELAQIVAQSKHILCRSDFCQLTDLCVWERTAMLVPTPGHPEQLYLADFYAQHYHWPVFMQSELSELPQPDEMAEVQPLSCSSCPPRIENVFDRLTAFQI